MGGADKSDMMLALYHSKFRYRKSYHQMVGYLPSSWKSELFP